MPSGIRPQRVERDETLAVFNVNTSRRLGAKYVGLVLAGLSMFIGGYVVLFRNLIKAGHHAPSLSRIRSPISARWERTKA